MLEGEANDHVRCFTYSGGFRNVENRPTLTFFFTDLADPFPTKYTLPGPDYFDEEAKCYGRLFEFCQVTFCHSRQWGRITLAKF